MEISYNFLIIFLALFLVLVSAISHPSILGLPYLLVFMLSITGLRGFSTIALVHLYVISVGGISGALNFFI